MTQYLHIAPANELIRYLAVLRRAFLAIRDYGKKNDRPGLRFGEALRAGETLPAKYHDGWRASVKERRL